MDASPTYGTRSVELSDANKAKGESQMEKEVKAAIESEMEVINNYKQLLENERRQNQQSKELYETTVAQLQAQLMQKSQEESQANAAKQAEEYINRN